MQAFRRRGINAPGAPFFSEEGMRWPLVDAGSLAETRAAFKGLPEPDQADNAYNRQVLAAFVKKNMDALGLDPAVPVDIRPLEVARVPTPDNDLRVRAFTTAIQRARLKEQGGRTGVQLVFDRAGVLRYAIRTGIAPRRPSTTKT